MHQKFEDIPSQSAPLPSANPTKSFWLNSDPSVNPLGKIGSSDPLPSEADVVIIGSGITGCSFAYHLGELLRQPQRCSAQISAVILEARDFCSGATGRNGGHLTPVKARDFQKRVDLHGKEDALRDIELEQYTVSSILEFIERVPNGAKELELVRGGHVSLLLTPEEVEAARADISAATEMGVDLTGVEYLEPDITYERFRVRYPAVLGPGQTIWPLKLVTKLFEHARRISIPESQPTGGNSNTSSATYSPFSLDLFTQTPVNSVESLEGDASYRLLVKTGRGCIKTSYVIHATNAYASYLLPQIIGPAEGIVPTRSQCTAIRGTANAKDWPKVGWRANDGYQYWFARPPKSDREQVLVILGGGRDAVPQREFNEANDSVISHIISETLQNFLPNLFPADFVPAEVEMEWTGIMGFTRDGSPMVGQVYGKDGSTMIGQYIAAGYSGHGMPRAFACAEVVAQMVYAEMLRVPWSPPKWFPRHLLTKKKNQ